MSDNFQTLWAQGSLNQHAINRGLQLIQETGRALPCKVTAVNGSLVTVAFECTFSAEQNGEPTPITLPQVTIPKAESQWLRNPTQVGDVGITVPADTFIGGVSGQGSGVADLGTDYGNLSSLVFLPIAATAFPASPDANRAWLNGPNGVEISDEAQTITIIVDHATGTIQMAGSGTSSGTGVVNETMLQNAMNAVISTIVTWANAHFQAGSNSAPAPSNPTATGSTKTFTT